MIEVISSVALNTVQDLGRRGLLHVGIGTAGAMDGPAMRVANLLVGNDEGAAVIEVQTFPFELRFIAATRVAVTGAWSAKARLGGRPLLPWWGRQVEAGEVLTLAQPDTGARCYVAVAGGIDVPEVLGSRSTHLRNGFGGFHGRHLAPGDRIAIGDPRGLPPGVHELGVIPPSAALASAEAGDVLVVRAIPGADYGAFPDAARDALWGTDWTITTQSDRAGYRLRGDRPLLLSRPMELRSYGVVAGIIQVPPSGQPIIQLADANTAGGYPRIAGVIEADLWRLAQAPLGSRIRLVETDYRSGVAAMKPVSDYLRDTRSALRNVLGTMSRFGAGRPNSSRSTT